MFQDELQNFITKIESQTPKQSAAFGIFQYGGGSDESFIRANKQGLLLFACGLLNAAKNFNESNLDKTPIQIDFESEWIDDDSDTFIQYIEPIIEKQTERCASRYKTLFLDKLNSVSWILVAIVLTVALLVGLWTIAKWIF